MLNVYIYPEAFNNVGVDDIDKTISMAITLGHELFIHYHFIEAIDLWQQGKYKDALLKANKDSGPNNGDYDHQDYITQNTVVSGINKMYNYLYELKNLIKRNDNVNIDYQKKLKNAIDRHDEKYIKLKQKSNR